MIGLVGLEEETAENLKITCQLALGLSLSLSTEKRFLETHSPSIFWLYSLHLLNSKILRGAH